MSKISSRKVVVVGAGAVGSAFAYALAQAGAAEEIVLTDLNADLAKGQALDLAHGTPFYPTVSIRAEAAPAAYEHAAVVVVTAGKAQAGPDQSRLDLLAINAKIVTIVAEQVKATAPEAILLVVSNPVDILTHVAAARTAWPRGRILGSGTVLDSARFRYLLASHCGLSPQSIHASILGEHGDSEFAAWSLAHVGGMPFVEYCAICGKCAHSTLRDEVETEVRQSAYHIIGYKGSTSFGVGMAMRTIVAAILRNERRVLTVSATLHGEYGLDNVTLGVPCIIGANGIERVIEASLTAYEANALRKSASLLQQTLADLDRKTSEKR